MYLAAILKTIQKQQQPITFEMCPAPELLLNTIRCTCKNGANESCNSGRCMCRHYDLACTDICCIWSGRDCTNSELKKSDTKCYYI